MRNRVLMPVLAVAGLAMATVAAPQVADADAAALAMDAPSSRSEATDLLLVPNGAQEQKEKGRGDDLARIRRWRSFLDRAHRAFFAAHMSTTAVQAKIEQADARIEELENAPANDEGGRSDITGDVTFLERAERAFTAAHMNTEDVKRWLAEAREGG